MNKRAGWIRDRLSPALVLSLIALFFSVSGVAIAVGTGSIDSREIKNESIKSVDVRDATIASGDIAQNGVEGADVLESSLAIVPEASVATSAVDSSTVGGRSASQLVSSTAFAENTRTDQLPSVVDPRTGSANGLASATITTQAQGQVLAFANAELVGATGGEEAGCYVKFTSAPAVPSSLYYKGQADDVGTTNSFIVSVDYAADLPAGTHTATLLCNSQQGTGSVTSEDSSLSLIGPG